MKKTLLALALALSTVPAIGNVAEAGRCKQPLPFGGWTWVPCTAPAPRENRRTPARDLKKTYVFYIYNVDTSSNMIYYIGQTKYKLRPGEYHKHTRHSRSKYVTVRFDNYTRSGSWEKKPLMLNMNTDNIEVWYRNRDGKFRWNFR